MPRFIGPRGMTALERINAALDLDYGQASIIGALVAANGPAQFATIAVPASAAAAAAASPRSKILADCRPVGGLLHAKHADGSTLRASISR
jgi:hypothetical protein